MKKDLAVKKAPVSVCLIVKNEELQLENCLKSVRDYVEEIVIVDTGSTDKTPEIALKYADKFTVYQDCNDETGKIISFAKARNFSFSLATQPWILWVDGDDEVRNAEELYKLIEDINKVRNNKPCYVAFPYEYSHDEHGHANLVHYRERLISPPSSFKWVNNVHEVLVPIDHEVYAEKYDGITIIHRRGAKIIEPNRNLRILETTYEKEQGSDARTLYYIGLEYGNSGQIDKAIEFLIKYLNASGWDDEKYMACLKLTEHYLNRAEYQNAIDINLKALTIKETWCEAYLNIAKCFYYIADKSKLRSDWQKCIHFAQLGLSLPPTETMLFVNPLEREFEIHKYLNIAYNSVGNVPAALESTLIGLHKRHDPFLAENKKVYEAFLARNAVVESVNKLKDNGGVSEETRIIIVDLIHNQVPKSNSIATYPQYVKSSTYPKGIEPDHFPVAIETPHAQAWGLPNKYEFDDLPLLLTDEQLQATVLMIWKEYMLHDEIMAAIKFLEDAPYRIKHSVATQKALALSKKSTAWMDDLAATQAGNSPADITVETGPPLPLPMTAQAGGRFDWTSSKMRLEEKHIDFGCFDGAMTNRWGLKGFDVTGVDLCETSIDLAVRKSKEFNTGAKYICSYFQEIENKVSPQSFDCATCCDTYEHLKDPVEDLLKPARKLLKNTGRFLLMTPFGSWTRGAFLPWAHPWRWATEKNKAWICDEPRAHIIAPTPWTVVDNFRKAGFWVKNSYALLCEMQDVAEQGNVCVEAYAETPFKKSGKDIVIFAGNGVEDWTPNSVAKTGIGGSELAIIEMSKRLVQNGHKVRVYNSCGKNGEGIYDGVEYYQTEKYQDLNCDTLIVSRQAEALHDKYNIKSKMKIIWTHDIFVLSANNALLLKADRILALSKWHRDYLISYHDLPDQQVIVTRNGIDLERFKNKNIERNKFKVVYSSSPDRGLPVLLDVWPKIKKQVPEAELHIFYGFKNWEAGAINDPDQKDLIAHLKQKLKDMEPLGVKFIDRVSQERLAEEFLSAGVWAYPTWFSETSCITAMEAQAAGLRIITSPIAALTETISSAAFVPEIWTSPEYQDKFVEETVRALTIPNQSDRMEAQNYAFQTFNWDTLAEEWDRMFNNIEKEMEDQVILPYKATPEYL